MICICIISSRLTGLAGLSSRGYWTRIETILIVNAMRQVQIYYEL